MPYRKRRDPVSRPAVERGIPVRLVDAILDLTGIDEDQLTIDSKLADDLGMDDLDLVELGQALDVEDACLEWVTVADVMAMLTERAAQLKRAGIGGLV